MQIVGSRCKVCGGRIILQTEGAYCPDCGIAFHKNCAAGGSGCPGCGKDYEALQLRTLAEERARLQESEAKGRRLVLACILILLVPGLLALALSFAASAVDPEFEFPVRLAFTLPLTCLVSVGVYLGVRWLRIWMFISIAADALLSLGHMLEAIDAIDEGGAIGDGVFTLAWGLAGFAIDAVVILILAFSPSVALFFNRRS